MSVTEERLASEPGSGKCQAGAEHSTANASVIALTDTNSSVVKIAIDAAEIVADGIGTAAVSGTPVAAVAVTSNPMTSSTEAIVAATSGCKEVEFKEESGIQKPPTAIILESEGIKDESHLQSQTLCNNTSSIPIEGQLIESASKSAVTIDSIAADQKSLATDVTVAQPLNATMPLSTPTSQIQIQTEAGESHAIDGQTANEEEEDEDVDATQVLTATDSTVTTNSVTTAKSQPTPTTTTLITTTSSTAVHSSALHLQTTAAVASEQLSAAGNDGAPIVDRPFVDAGMAPLPFATHGPMGGGPPMGFTMGPPPHHFPHGNGGFVAGGMPPMHHMAAMNPMAASMGMAMPMAGMPPPHMAMGGMAMMPGPAYLGAPMMMPPTHPFMFPPGFAQPSPMMQPMAGVMPFTGQMQASAFGTGIAAGGLTAAAHGTDSMQKTISAAQTETTTGSRKGNWQSYVTKEGSTYYYNVETKETTWEMPPIFEDDHAPAGGLPLDDSVQTDDSSSTTKEPLKTEEEVSGQLIGTGMDEDVDTDEDADDVRGGGSERKQADICKRESPAIKLRQVEDLVSKKSLASTRSLSQWHTLEERVEAFYALLSERGVKSDTPWARVLPMIVSDARYAAIPRVADKKAELSKWQSAEVQRLQALASERLRQVRQHFDELLAEKSAAILKLSWRSAQPILATDSRFKEAQALGKSERCDLRDWFERWQDAAYAEYKAEKRRKREAALKRLVSEMRALAVSGALTEKTRFFDEKMAAAATRAVSRSRTRSRGLSGSGQRNEDKDGGGGVQVLGKEKREALTAANWFRDNQLSAAQCQDALEEVRRELRAKRKAKEKEQRAHFRRWLHSCLFGSAVIHLGSLLPATFFGDHHSADGGGDDADSDEESAALMAVLSADSAKTLAKSQGKECVADLFDWFLKDSKREMQTERRDFREWLKSGSATQFVESVTERVRKQMTTLSVATKDSATGNEAKADAIVTEKDSDAVVEVKTQETEKQLAAKDLCEEIRRLVSAQLGEAKADDENRSFLERIAAMNEPFLLAAANEWLHKVLRKERRSVRKETERLQREEKEELSSGRRLLDGVSKTLIDSFIHKVASEGRIAGLKQCDALSVAQKCYLLKSIFGSEYSAEQLEAATAMKQPMAATTVVNATVSGRKRKSAEATDDVSAATESELVSARKRRKVQTEELEEGELSDGEIEEESSKSPVPALRPPHNAWHFS